MIEHRTPEAASARRIRRMAGATLAAAAVAALLLSSVATAAPFVGGGFEARYQTLSVPQLNAALTGAGLPELSPAAWLMGGSGYGPLVGSEGFTIGGFGAGGQVARTANDGRTYTLDIGYGGPRLGYLARLFGPLSVDAGIGVAFGGATLTVLPKDDPPSFSDGLTNFSQTTYDRFVLGVLPELTLSLALTPYMHLQAGAGYFWDTQVGEGWTGMRGTQLASAPADPFSGVQYRVGIVWGPDWHPSGD